MTINNLNTKKEIKTFDKELESKLDEKVEFWKDEIRIHGNKVPEDNDTLNTKNSELFVNYKKND